MVIKVSIFVFKCKTKKIEEGLWKANNLLKIRSLIRSDMVARPACSMWCYFWKLFPQELQLRSHEAVHLDSRPQSVPPDRVPWKLHALRPLQPAEVSRGAGWHAPTVWANCQGANRTGKRSCPCIRPRRYQDSKLHFLSYEQIHLLLAANSK